MQIESFLESLIFRKQVSVIPDVIIRQALAFWLSRSVLFVCVKMFALSFLQCETLQSSVALTYHCYEAKQFHVRSAYILVAGRL